MKFYLDEDLSPRLAERLRRRGVDAVSAFEVGNILLSDREQLAYATQEGRCLVTRNARHFVLSVGNIKALLRPDGPDGQGTEALPPAPLRLAR